MSIKVVKLKHKYNEHVTNLKNEQDLVKNVIENTFNKYMNEDNYNSMTYASDILIDNYRYVEKSYIIPEGKYIRYLDLRNLYNIKFRIGGFVLSDNGYTLTLKGFTRNIRISKNTALIFVQLNDSDRIRCAVNEYV